jgi:hypothetical protein
MTNDDLIRREKSLHLKLMKAAKRSLPMIRNRYVKKRLIDILTELITVRRELTTRGVTKDDSPREDSN